MHVALTDFSSYKAVVVARFLKKHYLDLKITSVDIRGFTHLLHSKYTDNHVVINVKNTTDPAYAEQLAQLIKHEKIDILIPINSQELDILLASRQKFDVAFTQALDYWGALNQYLSLHDKGLFQELVVKAGLAIPQDYKNLETACLPVVYKPTTASSSKGVVYIRTEDERATMIEKDRDMLSSDRVIQQFIEGEGVGFSGFFEKGEIKVGHAHLRLAEFPISGGSSVWRGPLSQDKQHVITQTVENLLKHVSWSGFAMFEFKMTPKGELYFIECNPRIWGSIHQGLANGVNYFSPLLGHPEKDQDTQDNIKTYLSPLLWVSLLLYGLKGNMTPFWRFIYSWRNNRVDVNMLHDPKGWLALIGRSF